MKTPPGGLKLNRRQTLGLLAAGMMPPQLSAAFAAQLSDSPLLDPRVLSGDLPPVADRLPKQPRVIDLHEMGRIAGRHGGDLRILIGGQRDVRYMPIIGYSRLMGYGPDLRLSPDILLSLDVEKSRIFTLHLRPGHRWSDGHPFTSEDFRYAWQDVMLHPQLGGIPQILKIGGVPPEVEIIDEVTVRFSWPQPMPDFLPALATPVPPRLFMPAHYLRQFHADYQSADKLAELAKEQRVDDWIGLHLKMSRSNRPENPDLPTLEPWLPTTAPPAQQFIFERNPFFHRVDTEGQQLPYVDRILLNVSSYDIIPAKVATGESDLQPALVDFADYTLLKEAEKRFPVSVSLWTRSQGSRAALFPNLTCADPVWRSLLRDVRVRRAMSLAINRTEINRALFFGLARESANTVLPESPLFRPEYASAWAGYDPEQANALLDAAGLERHRPGRLRKLPDGREAGIVVETAGESTLDTDILELIRDHFRDIGIGLWTRVSQRDLFRSRASAGKIVMSVWIGLDNGVPTPLMPPDALAPTADDQLQWPNWGVHYLSGGKQGHAPELPEAQQLLDLNRAWRQTTDLNEQAEIWHKMLQIHADQVFSIGTVNGAKQPVVRNRALRNVPEEGLLGYEPTALLGAYMPDTFWYEER